MSCIGCPYYEETVGWCEKVGGYGYCDDAGDSLTRHRIGSRPHKRHWRERDKKYKNHLKYLAEHVRRAPVYYKDTLFRHGRYVENPNPRYERYYIGSKFHKRRANKQVRRFFGELHNGSQYKKIYDYWWEVW